jgi:hypothetical protein
MCLVPGAKCSLTVAQCSHPVEYRCKFTPRFPEALSILAAEEELLMPQGMNPKMVQLRVVADLDESHRCNKHRIMISLPIQTPARA